MKTQEPLFSVTARDCEWSYTRGTGAGLNLGRVAIKEHFGVEE